MVEALRPEIPGQGGNRVTRRRVQCEAGVVSKPECAVVEDEQQTVDRLFCPLGRSGFRFGTGICRDRGTGATGQTFPPGWRHGRADGSSGPAGSF